MALGSIDDREELSLCLAGFFGATSKLPRDFERECMLRVGDIGSKDLDSIGHTEVLPKGSLVTDNCRRKVGFRSPVEGGNIEAW